MSNDPTVEYLVERYMAITRSYPGAEKRYQESEMCGLSWSELRNIFQIIAKDINKEASQIAGLRDYFAGQAAEGLLSRDAYCGGWSGKAGVERLARFAYEYADAMIAERGKQ
jgi:hypothetical protein